MSINRYWGFSGDDPTRSKKLKRRINHLFKVDIDILNATFFFNKNEKKVEKQDLNYRFFAYYAIFI